MLLVAGNKITKTVSMKTTVEKLLIMLAKQTYKSYIVDVIKRKIRKSKDIGVKSQDSGKKSAWLYIHT